MLARVRSGERIPQAEVFELGENCPAEFFRTIVEALSDSFDPRDAAAYERLMSAWPVPPCGSVSEEGPVCVLSRVTLGADIKITSMVLEAMKKRFPRREVVFAGSRKSAELFSHDRWLEVDYPRMGAVSERIAFALKLRERLAAALVIDPDSRISQLGHVPMAAPGSYFHFNSRTAGGSSLASLTDLTASWLEATFGVTGQAYIDPAPSAIAFAEPFACISLGVGDNASKRIAEHFEADLIRQTAERFKSVWIDRGAGGEEAARVTAAVEASGAADCVRYWEGSFAGFAALIRRASWYGGYDSAGQHAAAAAGIPLTTWFAGAPTPRFAARWRPQGPGRIAVRLR